MAPQSSAVKLQSRAAVMGAHKWSHAVSKTTAAPQRKIRIVHVVAPTVIKANVGEFREVVQRLTGKPNDGGTLYPSPYESPAESSWSPDAVPAGGGAMAAATMIKAEVKREAASPVTSWEEEEGIQGDIAKDFFQELEDFLSSSSSSCSQMVDGGGWH